MIHTIVTDIEGTTTSVAFVHDVLFPYARQHMATFLAAHGGEPHVAALLADVIALQPGSPLETLFAWMDADAKATPLKALQGLIWNDGYRVGALKSVLYPDVAPRLREWSQARVKLHVYSSGSEQAQRLLFAHSTDGDLSGLFGHYFDTRIGAKRESASYRRILTALEAKVPEEVLFLSDIEAELDAAEEAGLSTLQVVRAEDGTLASPHHPTVASFAEIRL
jgi:enolase-phosphatase E1